MDKQLNVNGETVTIRVGDDGVADLTRPVEPPIRVRIEPDMFEFAGSAPGNLARLIGRLQGADESDVVQAMLEFLDMVMLPQSKERFTERMGAAENPITFDHLQDLFLFLSEKYMGDDRPTQPGSSSPDGAKPGGPTLTGLPPSAVSTPPQFASQDY